MPSLSLSRSNLSILAGDREVRSFFVLNLLVKIYTFFFRNYITFLLFFTFYFAYV
jgi:hypothetical protein